MGLKDSDVTCLYGKTYNVCLGKNAYVPSKKNRAHLRFEPQPQPQAELFKTTGHKGVQYSDRWIFFGNPGMQQCHQIVLGAKC